MNTNPVDPNGLAEFSVVYTDRSLNHMSKKFQAVMNELFEGLCDVYQADYAVLVPGGGTFAMEAVARQLATNQKVLVVRNGWFSFRWTQIIEMGGITADQTVLCANAEDSGDQPYFSPYQLDKVIAQIHESKPAVVFMPHVETSAGLMLSDDYIAQVAEAGHAVGGLLVVDCIASGCMWLDMKKLGIDVLISAPQKGWSGSPGAGVVMLSAQAKARVSETVSTSFSADLGKWMQIMQAYRDGGHAYHATMPTDALEYFAQVYREAKAVGFDVLKAAQSELGNKVRARLSELGFKSVAASGFEAPGVVVCYTNREAVHKGGAFAELGVQIAAGVPLKCGEPTGFKTFRVGLFGLDKLTDVDAAFERLNTALTQVGADH